MSQPFAAIFTRSKLQITLSGSETEKEARAAEKLPIITLSPYSFVSFHEERVHRKRALTVGFRLFAKFGFDEGEFDVCSLGLVALARS